MADPTSDEFEFDTRAVRAGTLRTPFNEHSEAVFLTSSFVFENSAQAAERFSGTDEGYVYSRTRSDPRGARTQPRRHRGRQRGLRVRVGHGRHRRDRHHAQVRRSRGLRCQRLWRNGAALFRPSCTFRHRRDLRRRSGSIGMARGGQQSHATAILRDTVQSADGDH
jgi:hypothetical protein